MAEGGFFERKRMSPTGLTIVILLHGAVIGALAMSKMEMPGRTIFTPIKTKNIEIPPDPEPIPVPEPRTEPKPAPRTQIDFVKPILPDLPRADIYVDHRPAEPVQPFDPGPIGKAEPTPEPTPTPTPARKLEPARAKANLASYVSDSDYPASALRAEEQGTTRFRLNVGPDGRVATCTVTGSSGSSALDTTTCRIMKNRARFTPARDSDGRPASDTFASSIRWVLPDE